MRQTSGSSCIEPRCLIASLAFFLVFTLHREMFPFCKDACIVLAQKEGMRILGAGSMPKLSQTL